MFTGIIEEIGQIINFNFETIEITCSKILENSKIGDSICVNGVCQTIVSISENSFKANLSQTTRQITTFKDIKIGTKVNLERALTLNSRLGGHIVTGHIENIGKILKKEKLSEFYNIYIEIPKLLSKYIVKKGSVAIDGISLTVADITDNIIMLAIIPHTYNNTNLQYDNNFVNIETDILSKYVEKFLFTDNNNNKVITEQFLKENGF